MTSSLTDAVAAGPPRLRRLFARDGKCLDVAVDHGFFGEPAFLTGIERMGEVVATLAAAGPDAVQLSPGQAPLLQAIPGPEKPALVLRSDVANVYHPERPERLWSEVVENAVGRAIALDAACVVVNLLLLPGEPELYRACLVNAGKLRVACDEVGMPLMIEPLAMLPGAGGYGVDGDVRKIVSIVRQAAELGADIIKADPTSDLEDYHRVVEAAGGRPVLPRGGGRASDEDILQRTAALMRQGASGIVYGRNIIQHDDPAAMTRALMAIVHDGASAEAALEVLNG